MSDVFEGNPVIDSRLVDGRRVLLVKVENPDWDGNGYAVVRCFGVIQGCSEWDANFFGLLKVARAAFQKVSMW